MAKRLTSPALAFLAVLSLGPAVFASLALQSSHVTILDHRFRLEPLPMAAAWLLSFFVLSALWILFRSIKENETHPAPSRHVGRSVLGFIPFAFFFFAPLLLPRYLTRHDLSLRLLLFGLLILAAFIALHAEILSAAFKKNLDSLEKHWTSLPRRKRLLSLFLAAFLVYNACALLIVSEGITFSGDEPNYLMTSHSLLADQDVNLANNTARKDYFHFFDREKDPNLKFSPYGRVGRKGKGHLYPVNLPGLAVLLLPFYAASFLLKAAALTWLLKSSLAAWAALLAVQVYLLARDLWRNERTALLLWLLYAFTAPVLFYSIHLYPELVIAFLSVLVFRKFLSPSPLRLGHYFLCGLLLSVFPWFGVKYNFLLYSLLLVGLASLWTNQRARWRLLALIALPLLSQALFYLYTYDIYGSLSPFAVYEGVLTADKSQRLAAGYMSISWPARFESLLGYFLDQRDGLLLYAPLYFFSFLGAVALFRRSKKILIFFLLIIGPYLANYAFFTQRGAYAPQGRVLASVSWILILLVGYFLAENRSAAFAFLFRFSCLASFAVAGLLLCHPSFLYQPTTHDITARPGDLFVYLSNLHVSLPAWLPSFIKVSNAGYLPNYLWAAGLVVIMTAYALAGRSRREAFRAIRPTAILTLLAASLALWALVPRPSLYSARGVVFSPEKDLAFYPFSLGKNGSVRPSGVVGLNQPSRYKVYFRSRARLDAVKVALDPGPGRYDVSLRLFDLPAHEERSLSGTKEVSLAAPAFYPHKNLFLYELGVSLTNLSGESMTVSPFRLRVIPPGR